jgi:hypothetical protein
MLRCTAPKLCTVRAAPVIAALATHHIRCEGKIDGIESLRDQHRLGGIVLLGKPGRIVVEGDEEWRVRSFVQIVLSWRWQVIRLQGLAPTVEWRRKSLAMTVSSPQTVSGKRKHQSEQRGNRKPKKGGAASVAVIAEAAPPLHQELDPLETAFAGVWHSAASEDHFRQLLVQRGLSALVPVLERPFSAVAVVGKSP